MTTTVHTPSARLNAAAVLRDQALLLPLGDDRARDLYEVAKDLILAELGEASIGDRVQYDSHSPIMVVAKRAGQETLITQDGRTAKRSIWHHSDVDGPEANWVYYEVWTDGIGMTAHGYIDSRTRKLLQAG